MQEANHKKYPYMIYLGIPVLMILLALAKGGSTDHFALLLREMLLVLGYVGSVNDFWSKRVPNELVLTMLAGWILVMVPQLFFQTERALVSLINGALGFFISGLLFLIVYLVSRKGLGGGDVKLMAVSGLYLGLNGVLPAMLYGSVLSAAFALVLIALKKIGRKDTIPLVPFLYIGMLITMFVQ